MDGWNWSSATYRLDEITGRFPLPCVVQVTEGFLSETEAESVSAGDIIKIDSEMTLHKVAANFISDFHLKCADKLPDDDYIDLTAKEILVPLNYKGKLKVLKEIKRYTYIRELCKDFPRYAKLVEVLRYIKKDGGMVTIPSGTIIELDRVIPGGSRGSPTDLLVFGYNRDGRRVDEAIPVDSRGHFVTHPDDNEYTLKEAIDRYKLPQIVSFVGDEIQRVYTSDLMEGLDNMRTITETIRLNRLMSQHVLVGHYKPLEELEETEESLQRTLVVLPLNSRLVREIEVSVAEGVLDEDYETVFRVIRNTDRDMEIVDGTLYVDLAKDTGMRRLAHRDEGHSYENQKAPAVPPRRVVRKGPSQQNVRPRAPSPIGAETDSSRQPKNKSGDGFKGKKPAPLPVQPTKRSTGDYIRPDPPCQEQSPIGGFSLSEIDFGKAYSDKTLVRGQKPSVYGNLKKLLKPKTDKKQSKTKGTKPVPNRPQMSLPGLPEDDTGHSGAVVTENDLSLYEDIDENLLTKYETVSIDENQNKSPSWQGKSVPTDSRPVASIQPRYFTPPSPVTNKAFDTLSTAELVERLDMCGLQDFGKVCKAESLDGSFFDDVPDDILRKSPFNLDEFAITKFCRVKNGWVPK